MPKNPIDYSKALIYKIEHLEKPELCYVGSTTNLVKRKSKHKEHCNDENCNTKIYVMIRENGGWESFKMVVIKEYPCNTKIELEIEEEKCRKELQANLNNNRCHRTEEERKEYEKQYSKEYHQENKDKISEQKKDYYKNNKEIIAEKSKERYQNNKEEIKELSKERYQKGEKMTCPCGSTFRCDKKTEHYKTQKHQNFINNNNK